MMMDKKHIENAISRMFLNRHNQGKDVCGERLYERWLWHKHYRDEIKKCVNLLRGIMPEKPITGFATMADFERDNPGCILR